MCAPTAACSVRTSESHHLDPQHPRADYKAIKPRAAWLSLYFLHSINHISTHAQNAHRTYRTLPLHACARTRYISGAPAEEAGHVHALRAVGLDRGHLAVQHTGGPVGCD